MKQLGKNSYRHSCSCLELGNLEEQAKDLSIIQQILKYAIDCSQNSTLSVHSENPTNMKTGDKSTYQERA